MDKKDLILIALILLVNFSLRFYRLDFAGGKPIFDEKVYYLTAARSYLQNEDDPNIEHPPLGKELIAVGIKVFGDNPYGWRLPSLLFSLLGILLTYLLAKELFGGYIAPILGATLVSMDNLYFIHSRLAVLEVFLVTFILSSLLFLWRYYQHGKKIDLIFLSLSFGLALSTKWTALLILPTVLVFLYLKQGLTKTLLVQSLIISALGLTIYWLSYWPFIQQHGFWGFLVHQRMILGYWADFGRRDVWDPISYFLNHAPAWIFNPAWHYDLRLTDDGRIGVIRAMFNPVVFWTAIFFAVKSARTLWSSQDRRLLFLLLPIIFNFLPWLFVRRTQYLYYLLFSLPLLCLLSSLHLEKIWRNGREGRYRTIWLLTTAAFVFAYFYPLITSWPVGKAYFSPISVGGAITVEMEDGQPPVTIR